jgi:hypothetical protein
LVTRYWAVAISLLVLGASAGCAEKKLMWRGTATREQFAKDRYECYRDATGARRAANVQVNVGETDPWVQLAQNIRADREVNDVFNLCMESKGYWLVPESESR